MIAATTLFACAAAAQGQTPAPAGGTDQPEPSATVDETQAATMMAERRKMMERMQAMDRRLNELVAKMDAAEGAEKVDAIAAVVREMVEQRTEMHRQMMAMQSRMMGHMMQHMRSMQGGMMGMTGGRGERGTMQPMSDCPMVRELSQEAEDADQTEHHPEP